MKEFDETHIYDAPIVNPEENSNLFTRSISAISRLQPWFEMNNYIQIVQLLKHQTNADIRLIDKDRTLDNKCLWNYNLFWNTLLSFLDTMIKEKQIECKFSKDDFKSCISSINGVISHYLNDEYDTLPSQSVMNYLNFMIEGIKLELSGSFKTELLFPADKTKITDYFPVNIFYRLSDKPNAENLLSQKVNLKGKTVISFPSDIIKLRDTINDINDNGYNKYEKNVSGFYFPEIELIMIENGHHHIAVTKEFPDEAYAIVNIYPLVDVVDEFDIINEFWYNKKHTDIEFEPIADMRYAVLYKLIQAKILLERKLNKNKNHN